MPFASKAQARFMFARHPEIARRWAEHTPNMKRLPERASSKDDKRKKGKGARQKSADVFLQKLASAISRGAASYTAERLASRRLPRKFIDQFLSARLAAIKTANMNVPVNTVIRGKLSPAAQSSQALLRFVSMRKPKTPSSLTQALRPQLSGPGSKALHLDNVIGAEGPLGGGDITNGGRSVKPNYKWAARALCRAVLHT